MPELLVIADVCLCEYTSHGHCGLVCEGEILNDETLPLLAKMSVSLVKAGADVIAPSDMMDGRVAAIREALDANGHYEAPIMSYAVKYASAFYGTFRAELWRPQNLPDGSGKPQGSHPGMSVRY